MIILRQRKGKGLSCMTQAEVGNLCHLSETVKGMAVIQVTGVNPLILIGFTQSYIFCIPWESKTSQEVTRTPEQACSQILIRFTNQGMQSRGSFQKISEKR